MRAPRDKGGQGGTGGRNRAEDACKIFRIGIGATWLVPLSPRRKSCQIVWKNLDILHQVKRGYNADFSIQSGNNTRRSQAPKRGRFGGGCRIWTSILFIYAQTDCSATRAPRVTYAPVAEAGKLGDFTRGKTTGFKVFCEGTATSGFVFFLGKNLRLFKSLCDSANNLVIFRAVT